MISLVFGGPSVADKAVVGPAAGFRIAGNFVRELPGGTIVAQYERFHWTIRGNHYTTYECVGPVIAYFEEQLGGKSTVFGPFGELRCADGVMYADKEFFARFIEESLLWSSVITKTHWPMIVIAAPVWTTTRV
jgi:hypothetical protein